jgi:drug/metabolite transporter (DMT)-like permease
MKTKIWMAGIVGIIMIWCFIPCIWAIDSEINGTDHFIDGFIFAGITVTFLAMVLYFAKRDVYNHSGKK